jgi:Rad3-related DNA helicase
MIKPPFPQFPSWRPYQAETVGKVLQSKNKVMMISAPTGSGKTIIGLSICKEYQRSIYLCSTKTLQEQIKRDHPNIPLLMGRNNYPCVYNRMTESSFPQITCEDCIAELEESDECKSKCIYENEKIITLHSQVAILNMTYYLTETNYIGRFSNCHMVVVDECDLFEREILRFVSLSVSDKQMERFKLEPPQYKTKVESWKKWAEKYLPNITRELEILGVQLKKGRQDLPFIRLLRSTKSLHKKMEMFKSSVDDTWIYEEKDNKWEFKPTWISQFMKAFFWDHANRFVLMSATPPPARLLGLDDCEQIEIPSQFPKENRKIIYEPVANLTYKTTEEERPKLLKRIKEIMDSYPNEKGLIHSVSYDLAKYLTNNIKSGRIITHDGSGRTGALDKFKNIDYPAVLISPSMDRGVDLPYDAARWCIVAKVPFPDLSDKQVSSRLYSSSFGRYWYSWATACSVMQMTGRIIRAIDDYGTNWILDKQFENFYSKNSRLFYGWWTEALEFNV